MNKTYHGIIQLIKSAITQKPVSLPDDFNWKTAVEISRFHKIEALVYYGLFYSQINIPEEFDSIMKKAVFTQSGLDAQQEYEITKLCSNFDEKGIAYLPLKGMLIKKYYPKPEMRYMSDADVLIKTEEYSIIEPVMCELGYSFKVESNHEYVWTKRNMCVELHKMLIPSYNKDYYKYYGDGWRLAKLLDNKYIMPDEDFYIYLFTHLAKHYRDAGVGIKQFVDLWVYRNAMPGMDKNYINAELDSLQLLEFHQNCIKLLDVWFGQAEETEKTAYMTVFIFSSGVYGNEATEELSSALKETLEMDRTENIRRKFYLKKIFMPYRLMKLRYRVLERVPILLPIMWLVRIFDVLLFKRDSIKANAESLNRLTNENINAYEKSLKYVGLQFDFKEKEE